MGTLDAKRCRKKRASMSSPSLWSFEGAGGANGAFRDKPLITQSAPIPDSTSDLRRAKSTSEYEVLKTRRSHSTSDAIDKKTPPPFPRSSSSTRRRSSPLAFSKAKRGSFATYFSTRGAIPRVTESRGSPFVVRSITSPFVPQSSFGLPLRVSNSSPINASSPSFKSSDSHLSAPLQRSRLSSPRPSVSGEGRSPKSAVKVHSRGNKETAKRVSLSPPPEHLHHFDSYGQLSNTLVLSSRETPAESEMEEDSKESRTDGRRRVSFRNQSSHADPQPRRRMRRANTEYGMNDGDENDRKTFEGMSTRCQTVAEFERSRRRRSSGFDNTCRSPAMFDVDDPVTPPVGLFGSPGSTQRRRSVALLKSLTSPVQEEYDTLSGSTVLSRKSLGPAAVDLVRLEGIPWNATMDENTSFTGVPFGSGFGSVNFSITSDRNEEYSPVGSPRLSSSRKSPPVFQLSLNLADEVSSKKSPVQEYLDASDGDGSSEGEEIPSKERMGLPSCPVSTDVTWEDEVEQCREEKNPSLELYELELKEVPRAVFTCQHITSLDVSSNELTWIPAEIGTLPLLEKLTLKSNNIKMLPDSICGLSKLTHLYLDQNEITELPPGFSRLTNLKVLGLDWNDLAEFPTEVCKITKLQTLYMAENPRVATLPVKDMQLFGQLELHIDNLPSLVKQATEIKETTNVTLQWNQVFPDQILPYLYLGCLRSAQELRVYELLNIGYIASIGRELTVVIGPGMEQIQTNVDDLVDTDLSPLFDKVHSFIEKARESGKACLVHCFKGQSRSATMVMTYLMHTHHMTRDEALEFVRDRRPCVNPNAGFMQLMKRYEEHLGLCKPSTPQSTNNSPTNHNGGIEDPSLGEHVEVEDDDYDSET